jgi:hypothetical protein
VVIGVEKAFDTLSAKEQASLAALPGELVRLGVLTGGDVAAGTAELVGALDDLALDVPASPFVLGMVLGGVIAAGGLGLAAVVDQVAKVEGAVPRRGFVAAALRALQAAKGDEAVKEECSKADFKPEEVLKVDEEFDGPDEPDVATFLRQEGLEALLA